MPANFKLSYAEQRVLSSETFKLYRPQVHRKQSNPFEFYVIHDSAIDHYQYTDGDWIKTLSIHDVRAQQLYFADIVGDGHLMMIAKTPKGMDFYQRNGNEFKLIGKTGEFDENQFDDIYGWQDPGSTIQLGYFYSDSSKTTLITNRRKYGR